MERDGISAVHLRGVRRVPRSLLCHRIRRGETDTRATVQRSHRLCQKGREHYSTKAKAVQSACTDYWREINNHVALEMCHPRSVQCPSSMGRATDVRPRFRHGSPRAPFPQRTRKCIRVQVSSLAAAQDQNLYFQKPAEPPNEHSYRLSCRVLLCQRAAHGSDEACPVIEHSQPKF